MILDKKGVMITGANGFIGAALVEKLYREGFNLRLCARRKPENNDKKLDIYIHESLEDYVDWSEALKNIDAVVHTAARVHVMKDSQVQPLDVYRKVNTQATLNLAQQSAKAGVKRFIFISSIKVNGEYTHNDQAFRPEDGFIPDDPYALSKYEAEQGLLHIAEETGMEVVIIRPPLVYGPGVKANFAQMIKWVEKGWPLPFEAVKNKRSLVALDNLVDFILCCIEHKEAANQVFLISDGQDVSTPELLHKVARALGKSHYALLPMPTSILKLFAAILGKASVADRLLSSLQIDTTKAYTLLGWRPVVSTDQAIKKTIQAYLDKKNI